MFCEFILFLKFVMSLSGLRSKDKGRRGSRDTSVWTDKKNVVNVNIANAPVLVKVFNKDS